MAPEGFFNRRLARPLVFAHEGFENLRGLAARQAEQRHRVTEVP